MNYTAHHRNILVPAFSVIANGGGFWEPLGDAAGWWAWDFPINGYFSARHRYVLCSDLAIVEDIALEYGIKLKRA